MEKRFEYLVETISVSNLNKSLQTYLNTRGLEGWELVSFIDTNSQSFISDSCKLIFKREII